MSPERFHEITARYATLRLVVLGDYCLDRYLEIDPTLDEISIETGLPVLNVVRVRSQAGAAGTILNNLVALGVGTLYAVGFCGEDGEGYELRRALAALPGVNLDGFLQTPDRRTFTYCKPLLVTPHELPRELNRLDSKNWTPTPEALQRALASRISNLLPFVDAVIVMEQVELPETGAVTPLVRDVLASSVRAHENLPVLADSRAGLGAYPDFFLKMNLAELAALLGRNSSIARSDAAQAAAELARKKGKPVFVTMAEQGMVGAAADGAVETVPSHPLRGPIDVVGAGDSVTANLGAALAAGANLREAMELAMAAASIVVHQVGTTGAATVPQIQQLLTQVPPAASA